MSTRRVTYRVAEKFRYHEGHSDEGMDSPVLFLHGATYRSTYLRPLLTDFSRNAHHGYALDMPGRHALEGGRMRFHGIADYVEHAARFTERKILPYHGILPTAVGHSMGGLVAQGLAERGLVRRVVLLASAPPKGISLSLAKIDLRPKAGEVAGALLHRFTRRQKIGQTLLLRRIVGDPEKNRHLFRTLGGKHSARPWENPRALLELAFSRIAIDPARVTVPVLVVIPGKDRLVLPEVGHALAEFYGAEKLLCPELGHLCLVESGWKAMTSQIRAWMGGKRIAVAA